jgi:hypothetical protein
MNARQLGGLFRSFLLMVGVSGTTVAGLSDDLYLAVGTILLTIFSLIWQVVANSSSKLIEDVAKNPEVVQVVVSSKALENKVDSPKVEMLQ